MHSAQTFALILRFGLLEFLRFLKQFRIKANALINQFGFLPEQIAKIEIFWQKTKFFSKKVRWPRPDCGAAMAQETG